MFLLILTLIHLAVTKTTNTSQTQAGSAENSAYVSLHEVQQVNGGTVAKASYNVKPGGSFYLMRNNDVNNSQAWTPVASYSTDQRNSSDAVNFHFPENSDANSHYCIMYRRPGESDTFSRPFTRNNASQTWQSSRTPEQDNAVAQQSQQAQQAQDQAQAQANQSDNPNGTPVYTSRTDPKNGKGSDKRNGKKGKGKKNNSAAKILCSMFGAMAVVSIFM